MITKSTSLLFIALASAFAALSSPLAAAAPRNQACRLRSGFQSPVAARVLHRFGPRLDPILGRVMAHFSQTYATHSDQTVYVPATGRVVSMQLGEDQSWVTIAHPGAYVVQYYHLVEIGVDKGEMVRKGFYLGATTDEPFSIRVWHNGSLVDPQSWLCSPPPTSGR